MPQASAGGSGASRDDTSRSGADPRRWPVRHAVSAGGIVVRATGSGYDVAMIQTRNTRGDVVWGLPKGHIEDGEQAAAAAVREVREETGLDADIVTELDPVTYWFRWAPEQVRYRKTVHFFLMRMTGGDTALHDDEAEDVAFVDIERAAVRATFSSEAKLLRLAHQLVESW